MVENQDTAGSDEPEYGGPIDEEFNPKYLVPLTQMVFLREVRDSPDMSILLEDCKASFN